MSTSLDSEPEAFPGGRSVEALRHEAEGSQCLRRGRASLGVLRELALSRGVMTTSVTGCRTLVFDGDAVRFKGRLTRERKDVAMPVFMIERRFADQLDVTADSAAGINRINDEEGVRWLYSFLSADKRKTYCLYEAPSAEAIRRAAERAGLPADAIVEVTDTIHADGSKSPV